MEETFNVHRLIAYSIKQQWSTAGTDKLELSPIHSNELREPGALYRYMNWCIIMGTGTDNT